MALPTTTASTCRPSSATCSGLEIPKPTASGRSVTARTAATSGATAFESESRSPGTPGRGQENGVEPVAMHGGDILAGFFHRRVYEQAAIDARSGGVLRQPIETVTH